MYAKSCYEAKDKSQMFRGVLPSLVMVWWGILYSSATQIHFYDTGVKIDAEVYQATLNDVLPPLEETVFVDVGEWCFQQDSAALAHKAKKKCKNACKNTS